MANNPLSMKIVMCQSPNTKIYERRSVLILIEKNMIADITLQVIFADSQTCINTETFELKLQVYIFIKKTINFHAQRILT